ncbi:glucose/mannose transport system permease protein [Stackebrandtia albiflava]|uniref:Glucose/mannose transport system permease protein n=1 Tax=Stackebrandtia albiflava TaxID=406432 RepID=A0A562UR41_9ACTN|nr:carbohydrate ABC transporter permease [Stackebrandtia albiflava]TWJ08082.1 glucose/mannose transport system permease protein [Stackebrandtia albiflava]
MKITATRSSRFVKGGGTGLVMSRRRADPAIRSPWAPYVRVVKYVVLLLFVLVFLMPVYAVVVTALKTPDQVSVPGMWELPWPVSFDSFVAVWNKPEIPRGLLNSFLLAVPASIIAALLGAANGFVLSKWRFPGADAVFPVLLFGMFIPYQAVIIPMTQFMTDINLRGGADVTGGLLGLILVHVVYGIPITTLIFRSYYSGIPDSVFDSAQVDGAGMLRTFWHIALPLAPPAFAVTVIWQFTAVWNDFLFGVVMTSTTAWPITIGLNNIAAVQTIPFEQVMASALLASLPTLLVYILLGRFFMKGLMAGALKG